MAELREQDDFNRAAWEHAVNNPSDVGELAALDMRIRANDLTIADAQAHRLSDVLVRG